MSAVLDDDAFLNALVAMAQSDPPAMEQVLWIEGVASLQRPRAHVTEWIGSKPWRLHGRAAVRHAAVV